MNRIGSHLDEFKNEFQSDSLFKLLLSSMALAGIREEMKLNETGRIRWSTDLCCQLLFGRMRRVQAGCLCSMRFGPSRIHASATERTCRHSEWSVQNLGATDVESSDVESSLITTGCFLLNTEVPIRLGFIIFAALGSVSVAIQCFISLAVLVRTEFEMCDVFCRGGSDYVW